MKLNITKARKFVNILESEPENSQFSNWTLLVGVLVAGQNMDDRITLQKDEIRILHFLNFTKSDMFE